MSTRRFANWSLVLASLLISTGCGGSDTEPSTAGDSVENEAATGDAAIDQPTSDDGAADEAGDADAGETDGDSAAGFGELMEGTFLLTGTEDERYYVSDDELAFRLGGGCSDGAFGFSVAITDAAGTITLAMFNAQIAADLSGGVTGEFDGVDAEVTVIPGGDFAALTSYEGPIRMVVSEHDTGGVSADLNARRMSITLLGTLPGDDGDVNVDVTFRWVMGCP